MQRHRAIGVWWKNLLISLLFWVVGRACCWLLNGAIVEPNATGLWAAIIASGGLPS